MVARYFGFLYFAGWLVGDIGCSPQRGESAPASAAGRDSGTVAVAGATLPYVVEGQGRPCIVIGSRVYYPRTFSDRFKAALRCVYLDQRGFVPGAAAPSGEPYGVPVAVQDLEAARAALGMDRFVLVGHSIHGTMALAYARAHPEHVSHVIAIGAPPEWSPSPADFQAVARFWEQDASPGRKAQHSRNRAALTEDSLKRLSPSQAFIATYVANAAQYWADSSYDGSWLWKGVEPNMQLFAQLLDPSRSFSLASDSATVETPVLVALGRLDFVVPYTVWDGFRSPFKNGTVHVFAGAGHTPQLETAAEFDRVVLEWLDR